MAPLPENSTNRLWVKKTGITGTHEIMFRGQPGSNAIDLIGVAQLVLNATKGVVFDEDTWVSARYSERDSILSFPVDWTPIQGANGSTYLPHIRPFFIDWMGRGLSGRRVRWSIQGAVQFPDFNYRVTPDENPAVALGIEAFKDASSILATIGGSEPVIYNYANCGYNSYQQRKNRTA